MKNKLKKKTLEIVSYLFLVPFLEKILLHYTNNKYYGPLATKIIPLPKLHKGSPSQIVSRNGIFYRLNKADIVDWHVYYGIREAAKEKLYSLVKQGDIILDIGTNNADVAMKLARATGPKGKVFGFEPHIHNFKRAITNIELNTFTNLFISNIGLGCIKSKGWIKNVDEHNAGMNRISKDGDFEIEIDTLDNILNSVIPNHIDLIKIDVEGFELKVLEGAQKVLTEISPTLFIELDNNNLIEQSGSAKSLIELLENYDYICRNAISDEIIYSTSDKLVDCHFDIICKKNKK